MSRCEGDAYRTYIITMRRCVSSIQTCTELRIFSGLSPEGAERGNASFWARKYTRRTQKLWKRKQYKYLRMTKRRHTLTKMPIEFLVIGADAVNKNTWSPQVEWIRDVESPDPFLQTLWKNDFTVNNEMPEKQMVRYSHREPNLKRKHVTIIKD